MSVFALSACSAPEPAVQAPVSSPTTVRRPASTPLPTDSDSGSAFHRVLLEAEEFQIQSGWRSIAVGEGNYMVDSIGASHISGSRLLQAPADAAGALAWTDLSVPATGRYKLWARYEYPYLEYAVPFEVTIEQGGREIFRQVYGRREASRLWFFGKPDAPWQDFPNGVEGLPAEAYPLDLAVGPARLAIKAVRETGPQANRNLDFLFLTDDLEDTFRSRGVRAYPLLDEIGWATPGRAFVRITNPSDAGGSVSFEAQYSINRQPWSLPMVQIDRNGLAARTAAPEPLAPGERTPWVDLSCRDTTHDCHLALHANYASGPKRFAATIEVAAAPRDDAILRKLDYRETASDRLLLNLPSYPGREPEAILTGEEVVDRILGSLGADPAPVGKPPEHFLVYGSLGSDFEANLSSTAALYERYRRLFGALGPSALEVQKIGNAVRGAELIRSTGRQPPPSFDYGGYRWYPSDENLERAARELDSLRARQLLRGFNYGDEVKLTDWLPRDGRDEAFRTWLQSRGDTPREYLATPPAADEPPESLWAKVSLQDSPTRARDNPRLYVESQRFLEQWAIGGLAAQAARLRGTFGENMLFGASFSPHPYFWPQVAQWVRLFRAGAANLASQDDYWWQASELGPQSAGYLLDAMRAGLGGSGVVQPYVMPHSPGNSDRDFRLGVATALIHGARALDFFNVGPEQTNSENYIARRDLSRYRVVRDTLFELGAVEDLLLAARLRPAAVGLVMSDSTDRWEQATPGLFPLLSAQAKFPSLAYAEERKFLWTALRHAQAPSDTVLEEDLARDAVSGYSVIYLVGDHLTPDAARGLARWVDAGGTLVSIAGSAMRDDYDAQLDVLLPVFGLRRAETERRETFFRPRVEVPRLQPLDLVSTTVDGREISFSALGIRQPLDPLPDTAVRGRFSNSQVAITEHVYGRGRAVLFGTLPATAYVQSGFPSPPPVPDRGPGEHTPLTAFRADLRRLLTSAIDGLAPSWPIASDPLVEVGQLETSSALLYILANSRAERTSVQLRLNAVGPVARVMSLHQGQTAFEQHDRDAVVRLELDDVDYLIVERA